MVDANEGGGIIVRVINYPHGPISVYKGRDRGYDPAVSVWGCMVDVSRVAIVGATNKNDSPSSTHRGYGRDTSPAIASAIRCSTLPVASGNGSSTRVSAQMAIAGPSNDLMRYWAVGVSVNIGGYAPGGIADFRISPRHFSADGPNSTYGVNGANPDGVQSIDRYQGDGKHARAAVVRIGPDNRRGRSRRRKNDNTSNGGADEIESGTVSNAVIDQSVDFGPVERRFSMGITSAVDSCADGAQAEKHGSGRPVVDICSSVGIGGAFGHS